MKIGSKVSGDVLEHDGKVVMVLRVVDVDPQQKDAVVQFCTCAEAQLHSHPSWDAATKHASHVLGADR